MSKEARKRYLSKPENQDKHRKYMKEYLREYRKRPEVQAKLKSYRRRPEVMERHRLLMKERRKLPEIKLQGRNSDLKSRYGITLEEFNERLKRQRNKCILCGQLFSEIIFGLKVCVDHDHSTGAVRGLVHRDCNTLLGYLDRLTSESRKIVLFNLPNYRGSNE